MIYTELVSLIQQYTDNDEATFVTNIPNFVRQNEERIFQALSLPAARQHQAGTMTLSSRFLSIPTGMLYIDTLLLVNGSNRSALMPKDISYLREAYPDQTSAGIPSVYAVYDDNTLIVAPTPNQAYGVEMEFYAMPTSIVTASTTWIGTNCSELLLYGCLLTAYVYMKGEQDVMAYYKALYDAAMERAKNLVEGRGMTDNFRRGSYRTAGQ